MNHQTWAILNRSDMRALARYWETGWYRYGPMRVIVFNCYGYSTNDKIRNCRSLRKSFLHSPDPTGQQRPSIPLRLALRFKDVQIARRL
jgi:hypothetical protein